MNSYRTVIASILIALVSSQVLAQDEEADDPAPSGNEQTRTSVGTTGAVSGPGKDYDDGSGNSPSTKHDMSGWEPSHEDDTGIDYPEPEGE